MTEEKLFREDGTPRFIRCFETKRDASIDKYCVVYTGLGRLDKAYRFRVQYVSMNAGPYHPQGFCQHEEAATWEFCPRGSRIRFYDLPVDCRRVVIDDYCDWWGVPHKDHADAACQALKKIKDFSQTA
jgi:hypothetical protein